MKPHRIRMTHNLLLNYGLYRKMEIYGRELKAIKSLPTKIAFLEKEDLKISSMQETVFEPEKRIELEIKLEDPRMESDTKQV
nr:unnamed protein product [Callosobruchus analis]